MIARGSRITRGIAGGALGLLAIWVALATYPVLVHGLVLSTLPATAARALVVLTFCSAAAAIALGFVVYRDIPDQVPEESNGES